ncbi:MAG: hypothetical protein VX737_00575 [Pseudomonadota bacterium]|nr:hypothetical protein [Pseudomonadota bacterium]
MYIEKKSIWKAIQDYLNTSQKNNLTTMQSDDIQHKNLETIKSIILRPSNKTRVIAPEHRRAFDQPSMIDSFRQRMFNWQIERPNVKKEWRKAQAWWQDLYGEYVDENDHINQTETHHNNTPVNITDWIKKNIPFQTQHTSGKHTQEVYHFIQHWSEKIKQLNSQLIQEHNAQIKKLLLRVHPDRNGCSEACTTLVEWKEITSELFKKTNEEQDQTTDLFLQHTSRRARPWHIWSLYLENQTRINIQKEKNTTHDLNQQTAKTKQ